MEEMEIQSPADAGEAGAFSPEEYGVENREAESPDTALRAIIEAAVYVTDEPLTAQQIAQAAGAPLDKVKRILDELTAEYQKPEHGLFIREIASGYQMATKAEHHDAIRNFVKNLKPPLKLSLAALETLAVIAYKQPVTAPEIMDIRGVQGAGVLKTLLDRKLVAAAGRKNVVGKPILYKTTKEFLVQFGLKDLAELPTLKEFEEIGRMALTEEAEAPAESGEAPVEGSGEVPGEETGAEAAAPPAAEEEPAKPNA